MDYSDIIRYRLHNEHLVDNKISKPEEAVELLGAVQAQDFPAAKWAIGQRVDSLTDPDIQEASDKGRILRTHMMRPTWHFVSPKDIAWIQKLTSPRVRAILANYNRKMGLSDSTIREGKGIIGKALRGNNHLTRKEMAYELKKSGITASGQKLAHILMDAELDALICNGMMKGKQQTYALVEERAPKAKTMAREKALSELTTRFFTSHGPALLKDFSWWSGLTMKDVRMGVELAGPHLTSEVIDQKTYWFSRTLKKTVHKKLKEPFFHLLPNYDEYLIAYKDHTGLLDKKIGAYSAAVYSILSRHIICMNGKVIGGWKGMVKKNEMIIKTKIPIKLSSDQRDALKNATEKYSRFLGMKVRIL
jgi:hypothetical protein